MTREIGRTWPQHRIREYVDGQIANLPTQEDLSGAGGAERVGYSAGLANAIPRTVMLKLRESVSVMDYGARGDGVNDDTEYFRAAMEVSSSTPRAVLLPPAPGGYLITDQIDIPSSRSVIGSGFASRLLRRGTGWPQGRAVFRNASNQAGNRNIVFSKVYIDGFRSEYGGSEEPFCYLFHTSDPVNNRCTDIYFEGCEVHNWIGITYRFNGADRVRVTGCVANNNKRGGIVFARAGRDIVIAGNLCLNLGDDAIALNANEAIADAGIHERFAVVGNVTLGRGDAQWGAGIIVRGGRRGTIAGNFCRNHQNAGIVVDDYFQHTPDDIAITGNTVTGGFAEGIRLRADVATGIAIKGNTVNATARHGIRVGRGDGARPTSLVNIEVKNNRVRSAGNADNATSRGIFVEGTSSESAAQLEVEGNQVDNSAGNGIELSLPVTHGSVSGNSVRNSSAFTTNSRQVQVNRLSKGRVSDNTVTESRGTKLNLRGISIDANCSALLVADNFSLNSDTASGNGVFVDAAATNITSQGNKVT